MNGHEPLTLSGLGEPPQWKYAPVLYVLGGLTMVGGAIGLVIQNHRTHPVGTALYFVGGAVLHDAIVAPAAILVGLVARALVPEAYRAVVRGGLIVSGVLALISLPLVLGKGRQADNPSHVPLPYGRNLLLLLAITWGVVLMLCLVRLLLSRNRF